MFEISTFIFSADITPEMLKLCRVTKVNVFRSSAGILFLFLANFKAFEFSAASF